MRHAGRGGRGDEGVGREIHRGFWCVKLKETLDVDKQ
jgi:hypothetical protein